MKQCIKNMKSSWIAALYRSFPAYNQSVSGEWRVPRSVDLAFQHLSRFFQGIRDPCRILAACLRHVRASAAATADTSGDAFHQVARMCALLHRPVCGSRHKADFAVISGREHDYTTPSPSFSLSWSPRSRSPFMSTPSICAARSFTPFTSFT